MPKHSELLGLAYGFVFASFNQCWRRSNSMTSLADYNHKLSALLNSVNTAEFQGLLVETLRLLTPCDDATIIVYERDALPYVDYFESRADGSSALDKFINGAFLLDPYYQAAKSAKFGFYHLNELAPTGFRDCEYYRNYYSLAEYQDECGFLIHIAKDSFINLSLARLRPPTEFKAQELQTLRDASALIQTISAKHWGSDTREPSNEPKLRAQLGTALDNFGSSVLTQRETQVVKLILNGHSTLMIAEALCISVETVKLHRKHAYAKLSISSQAELFHLFIDSLMSSTDYNAGDPLHNYLSAH